jgi:hypothetical protein
MRLDQLPISKEISMRCRYVLVLATAAFFAASTSSSADPACLHVDGEKSGNFLLGCLALEAEGNYVWATPVSPAKPGLWCATVDAIWRRHLTESYPTETACKELTRAGEPEKEWVRVLFALGTGKKAEFATLPSVKTFKGLNGPEGAETLKAGSIATTACETSSSTGEITSMDTIGALVIKYKGCTVSGSGKVCTIKSEEGSPAEGEIITKTLKGELGTVKESEATSEVGLLLEPASGNVITNLAETSCAVKTSVTGLVAGEVAPLGEKGKISNLLYGISGGSQQIHKIAVLSGTKEPALTAYSVSAAQEGADVFEFGGEIEIT